jgi:hypothetical protein
MGESLPASDHVQITFEASSAMQLRLAVFDLQGRHIRTVKDGRVSAGLTTLAWNLSDREGARVKPGIYFLRASFPAGEIRRRLVVIR